MVSVGYIYSLESGLADKFSLVGGVKERRNQ